ncbi:MAG: ATP-dependent DNA helicase RecG [Candidatus Hydrogenedentes bacterium]|nr:ATP-dependent DNA helicase RecG [Candidatus Hydrogenedentota bacterium]
MAQARLSPDDPVVCVPGVGEKRAILLEKLGIQTVRDLLLHLPRRHEDRSRISEIATLCKGATATIEAEVVEARKHRLRGRLNMAALTLKDSTGTIRATFFGRGYLANSTLAPGTRAYFTGEVAVWQGLALKNPEFEPLSDDGEDAIHAGRIVPVYGLTEGLNQRVLRRIVYDVLFNTAVDLPSVVPDTLDTPWAPSGLMAPIRKYHFPDVMEDLPELRERLAYEELLALQIGVQQHRWRLARQAPGIAHRINGPMLRALGGGLPFRLTGAQERAISALLHDMARPQPMARLIQGDVGCGKTIVALHAVACALDGGYQCAVMAPTEVLAEQHGQSFRRYLEPMGVRVALLTGTRGSAPRKGIAAGTAQVVVGTHALIQEKTQFARLGLVIIDEQHRFGVLQRNTLTGKGEAPDLLAMTATPIPRSLALTVYGGMDLTLIPELPPGRHPIKTRRIPEAKLAGLYTYICERAAAGERTYIICPLVEASASRSEWRAVTDHYEALSSGPLSGVRTALLHGRMASVEKEAVLRRFIEGDCDVLFSTTVVEVGIDVPEATTMVIENAGTFGLTQLHQLRGRIGRSDVPSFCFLSGKARTPEGEARLGVFCSCSSGFDLAEADLKLRGPGEFTGLRQAGLSDLKVADLAQDLALIERAQLDAQGILERDPGLALPAHDALRQQAVRFQGILL